MDGEFEADPERLRELASRWRGDSDPVRAFDWAALATIAGDGSDVLMALRGCSGAGSAAFESIADRIEAMARLVFRFADDVQGTDAQYASAIEALTPR